MFFRPRGKTAKNNLQTLTDEKKTLTVGELACAFGSCATIWNKDSLKL